MSAAQHPVAQLLRERVDSGSLPNAREDPHCTALVLEGGGMRGAVSAGMVAALERLGVSQAFDLVVGSSAGAINGAALLSGVAQRASDAYCGPLASKEFVNPLRILRGKPVIDVNDVLGIITQRDVAGHERVISGGAALHCVAVDVDTAEAVDLHGMTTEDEVWNAILASSRMPWAGGPPVEFEGRRYLDGGMASPVPVSEAIAAGATHVLALQTRPFGIARKSASKVGDWFIERHLRGLNPQLVTLYRERVGEYDKLVADIEKRTREASGPPYVLGLRPAEGTPIVSQLERNATLLTAGAKDGERLVEEALGATDVSRSSATPPGPR
jgi:predicted patatin/cPLA2 family phospholipase